MSDWIPGLPDEPGWYWLYGYSLGEWKLSCGCFRRTATGTLMWGPDNRGSFLDERYFWYLPTEAPGLPDIPLPEEGGHAWCYDNRASSGVMCGDCNSSWIPGSDSGQCPGEPPF